jgi:DNA polymerase IV
METIANRNILHLDLDTFFVSVERLQNSQLNGKPVIVGGFSDRAVVSSCSYESRQFGVHSGMPIKMARQLCRDAIVLRGDMDRYSYYSGMVTEIIDECAPVYEKMSIDEFYMDLTGMDRFFGCQQWSHELRMKIIKNTGLPLSMGLSPNKTVSKIATGEAKPCGELQIQKQLVLPFLEPLSIQKIPGVGDKTYRLLRTMGIATIRTLRQMPLPMVKNVLGENGEDIWKKANGIDNSPVKPYREQKSMSTETTFEEDTTDVKRLNEILTVMTEKLAFELRQQQKLTSCVTVKIRYSNFDTHTQQRKIQLTSLDYMLTAVAKELFDKLYSRRLLIRLIGVKFSNLVYGFQQLDLFNDKPEIISLYSTLDKLKNKFGHQIVRRAIAL